MSIKSCLNHVYALFLTMGGKFGADRQTDRQTVGAPVCVPGVIGPARGETFYSPWDQTRIGSSWPYSL